MVANIDIAPGSPPWLRLARLAKRLSLLTLLWLSIEGAVGVVAGVLAGSIALVAFGLDSAIEGLASVIVIWRFTGSRTISADAERRAQKWVAISFFLLAPYVAAEGPHRAGPAAAAQALRRSVPNCSNGTTAFSTVPRPMPSMIWRRSRGALARRPGRRSKSFAMAAVP